MPAQESGVLIYGEQRGAAVCDFDGDGRIDLAVGQNSAETKLFHNEKAKPGLKMRLLGTENNSAGIGTVIRNATGPAHEIHAGSGYWSQDSSTVVLANRGGAIRIRWPGGKETMSQIPAGATNVTVDFTGKLSVP
jgi:hypothetical protein